MEIYNFSVNDILGNEFKLDQFKDKVLLIVNTASQCGFTSQYSGLETLYEKYRDKGLVVLGFPCNQFGAQEPGTSDEINEFCRSKFDIKFPIFEKIEVNGENTHPLYQYLKEKAPGLLGSQKIKWNFTKFLVGKNALTVERFASTVTPQSMEKEIQKALEINQY